MLVHHRLAGFGSRSHNQILHHLLQVCLWVRHDPLIVCPQTADLVKLSFAGFHKHAHLFLHPLWFDISQDLHGHFEPKPGGLRRSLGECTSQRRMYSQRSRTWPVLPDKPFHAVRPR